jgi:GNAT superfamily N-acetyltransferase
MRNSTQAAVDVRTVASRDEKGLRAMFSRLSSGTIYQRFHMPYPSVPEWMLGLFLNPGDGQSLVATVGDKIVGHAMYARTGDSRVAEAAIVVEDAWQSKGIGKLLLSRLAGMARERDIEAFDLEVLGENRRMLGLADAVFSETRRRMKDGSYHVRAPLRAPDPADSFPDEMAA